MAQQLRLLDTDLDRFRIDETTKAAGRRGIEKARAALAASAERVEFADPSAPGPTFGRGGRRPVPASPANGSVERPADAA